MEQKDYLTEKEACDYLRISRGTLFNYVRQQLVKRYQQHAPRKTLYKKSELDALKQIRPKDQTTYEMFVHPSSKGQKHEPEA